MDLQELPDLAAQRERLGEPWLEFMRYPALSVGLYVLEPGEPDRQSAHTEDEIYYVVEGRGQITVGEEVRPVGPGSVIHVASAVPHQFHDIRERLTLLVVFAPPEGSLA
ncbi:MAG TPA: cupin domain-containing protein [Candidatus Limnocylindrales bacterium]|jgi:mannose-6-phosphate isomerase-like protein (cupin superfamily)